MDNTEKQATLCTQKAGQEDNQHKTKTQHNTENQNDDQHGPY